MQIAISKPVHRLASLVGLGLAEWVAPNELPVLNGSKHLVPLRIEILIRACQKTIIACQHLVTGFWWSASSRTAAPTGLLLSQHSASLAQPNSGFDSDRNFPLSKLQLKNPPEIAG